MDMSETDKPAETSMLERVHKTHLPPEVEEIFKPLRNEISFVHGHWEVYQQIFDDPKFAKVSELTPGGFRLMNLAMRHEIIMGLSRVTDPKGKGQRTNLTLEQLLAVFEKHCIDPVLMKKLTDDAKLIHKECEPFRNMRNRSVAHLDLKTFLGSHEDPLPAIDGAKVQECLNLLSLFMNEILGCFTTNIFDFVPHLSPSPRNIVYGLDKFLEWQPTIDEIERKELFSE